MIVGVVGIGHVQGIVDNWEKDIDVQEIMRYILCFLIPTSIFAAKMLSFCSRKRNIYKTSKLHWAIFSVIYSCNILQPDLAV